MNEPGSKEGTDLELLAELVAGGDRTQLVRQAPSVHPADLAEMLDGLETLDEKLLLFDALADEQASEVIRKAGETTRSSLLAELADVRIIAVVEGLDTDDAADLLGELPEERRRSLLSMASPKTRREIAGLLTYPEDSAGGIMKTEVASIAEGTSVSTVGAYIRRHADLFHDIHNVFVTDGRGRLSGFIPLRTLIFADAGSAVETIMETDPVTVRVDVDQEEVAHLFEKYDLMSIPVVDGLGRLAGRITVDDIVGVIEEEATEDMLRLAGVGDESIGLPKPAEAIRARLPWLGLNLITATLSAAAISLFEGTIESLAIAAAFMTIVASQGGNVGVQTMTLVVRGLALGEVNKDHAVRILGRETLIALVNGMVLGLAAATVVYLWRGNLSLALVLASAMVLNLIVAAALGSLVPLTLKTLRVDPAISSSVLVTAGTDILGFLIFLSLLVLVI